MKYIENAEDERFSDAKMHSDYHNSTFKTCFDTFWALLKNQTFSKIFRFLKSQTGVKSQRGGLDEVKSTTKKH